MPKSEGRGRRVWRGAARTREERGSTTLLFAVCVIAIFLVMGVVVDGGRQLNAARRADALAQEAARAAGQQIDPGQAIPGEAIVVPPDAAEAAVRTFLGDAGVSGTVSVSDDGQTLTVTVTDTYTSLFTLGKSATVTGTGTAHLKTEAGG
jgi:Flp pilus assembly protein TadG